MTNLKFLCCILPLLVLAGCADNGFVPVSGVVKINGKPYDQAVVTFQPIGSPERPNPGRGSSAYTDAEGRYLLMSDGINGAVAGKHLVRIMTRGNDVEGESPEGGSSDEVSTKRPIDPIPPEWNALSKVEFEVPSGGTDKADFDIPSKRMP